jgi:AraC-like DNA-binding protein
MLFSTAIQYEYRGCLRAFSLSNRLKEAAARIDSGELQSMVELAQQLGYYDQAHLIRDFRAIVAQSPSAYRRSAPDSQRA